MRNEMGRQLIGLTMSALVSNSDSDSQVFWVQKAKLRLPWVFSHGWLALASASLASIICKYSWTTRQKWLLINYSQQSYKVPDWPIPTLRLNQALPSQISFSSRSVTKLRQPKIIINNPDYHYYYYAPDMSAHIRDNAGSLLTIGCNWQGFRVGKKIIRAWYNCNKISCPFRSLVMEKFGSVQFRA